MNPVASKEWASLSLYESTELLKRFAKARTGRALSDAKAREIAAHFSQGREYFGSAAGAGELVRPLILYYGAMALARGAALFLDAGKSKVEADHGLETPGWGDVLTRPSEVPDSAVTVKPVGTFPELARLTGNSESVQVPHAGIPNVVTVRSPGNILTPGSRLTIREILGQIPDVAELYEQTFGERPRRLRCEVQMVGDLEPGTRSVGGDIPPDQEVRRKAWVGVVPTTSLGTPEVGWVVDRVSGGRLIDRGAGTLLPVARDPVNEVVGAHLFDLYFESGSEQHPRMEMPLATAATGEEYLKLRTDGGILLSTLLALHLVAFAAGTLVRYHPGYWALLVGRAKGDAIAPVLSAAISAVEERYPALILEAVGG